MRQSLRRYLFTFVRERARQRWTDEHVGMPRVVAAGTLLDPGRADDRVRAPLRRLQAARSSCFTIPTRLARILNAAGRPVQIIFAGKAHPADDIGKHHLQRVYRRALDPLFGGRVAFVDDYDLHVAHFLVQGCDVWLNTPRKPLEASGTSGMKAAINGVPHLSIGDGWWAEGFNGTNGWVIDGGAPAGQRTTPSTPPTPTRSTGCSRKKSCPAFYDRDASRVPRRWLATVKEADPHRRPRVSPRAGWSRNTRERMYAPGAGEVAVERSS